MAGTFPLAPRGAEVLGGGAHRLAQASRRLVGELVDDGVRTWLDEAGKRIALM